MSNTEEINIKSKGVECKYLNRLFKKDCIDYPDKCNDCRYNTYSDEPYIPYKPHRYSHYDKRAGL